MKESELDPRLQALANAARPAIEAEREADAERQAEEAKRAHEQATALTAARWKKDAGFAADSVDGLIVTVGGRRFKYDDGVAVYHREGWSIETECPRCGAAVWSEARKDIGRLLVAPDVSHGCLPPRPQFSSIDPLEFRRTEPRPPQPK